MEEISISAIQTFSPYTDNNDDDIYSFFAFFIISNCMPYYYLFYNSQ